MNIQRVPYKHARDDGDWCFNILPVITFGKDDGKRIFIIGWLFWLFVTGEDEEE